MNPDDLRAFARRDWAALDQIKDDQRAESYRSLGWRESRKLALSLYDHAQKVAPCFPDPDARAEDLEHHHHLKQILDRAAHAFSTR